MNNIQYPVPKFGYEVLVRCFTYNQSKYIEDTLNGFVMQRTTFPFVCLVMDDASTDGEPEIIKAWMARECDMSKAETIDIPTSLVIIVPHKTNDACTFAFYLLKQNLYGKGDEKMNHVYPWREKCKFEAICEGDDIWIVSNKLQAQYDFMTTHNEYVMCCHNAIVIEDNSWYRSFNSIQDSRELTLEDCVMSWIIHTASLFISKEVLITPQPWSNKFFFTGDQCLITTCAVIGKIHFIKEYMSI